MEVVGAFEEGDLNLKATQLTLGLPGTECQRGNKRSASSLSIGSTEIESAPPAKSQIVGWPPVRSSRKNALQAKKTGAEGPGNIYVKVSMDGAPYLRKIDLKMYSGYVKLLKALEDMFKSKIDQYSERNGCIGSDCKPTYEDKDGDWMLVGDVPWEMFMSSCKRMRIIKEQN